ncbi:MAG: catechol 2,3-dioxygenase-like lactoylglutathione lyase family enzyme [Bacteroidia bacterium]|jgi:catechol 2,3-dioxygenase-like lactoylglutathione lyase family enzyme
MKIKALTLYTSKLSEQRIFFSDVFGFDILDESRSNFSIQVGHTKLTFKASETEFIYHYCFLIPSNKLNASIKWLQSRLEVITYEDGRIIEPGPKDWNADSVYFLDPAGNILEFIVRYDLKNHNSKRSFDISQLLCINEIGIPSNDLVKLNSVLETEMGSKLWTGNLDRFGANGTQNGLFLLVNYETKKTWFPTDIEPTPSLFHGIFEINDVHYDLTYRNEVIKTYRGTL